MRVEMTTHGEHSFHQVVVKITESEGKVVPTEHRQAIFQAVDQLMTAVEKAEHARGPLEGQTDRLPATDLSCPSCGAPFEEDCECKDDRLLDDDRLHYVVQRAMQSKHIETDYVDELRLHIDAQAERITQLEHERTELIKRAEAAEIMSQDWAQSVGLPS